MQKQVKKVNNFERRAKKKKKKFKGKKKPIQKATKKLNKIRKETSFFLVILWKWVVREI